ncbi:sensor histidine kinase [Flavobacterium sp.]|uniref:sensor histidine kinase n=1 Tax=Flavobacterium sp. TaxID=239 RepID=UPI004048E282
MRRTCIITSLFFFLFSFSQNEEYKLASKYYDILKIDSANYFIKKSLSKCNNCDEQIKADIYVKYGKILKLQEKVDSTLYYYFKAEKIYTKHNDFDKLVYLKTSIADVFRYRNVFHYAKKYIEEAKQLIDKNKIDTDILAYYYNRRAPIETEIYFNKSESIRLSKKIIALEKEISDKELVVYSYNELAYALSDENPKKGLELYNKGLELAKKNNLILAQIDILGNLSRCHFQNHKNLKKKIAYLYEALALADKINSFAHKKITYENLYKSYELKRDYGSALKYFKKFHELVLDKNDSEKEIKISELEEKYNTEKKEEEIKSKNNQIKSATNRFLLLVLLFALAMLGLSFTVYFYRKIKVNSIKLEALSSENEFLVAEANHRINNNLQLIIILINEELKKATLENSENIRKILTKVDAIATLHKHLYHGSDKKNIDIKKYLKDVHVNFFEIFKENNVNVSFDMQAFFIKVDVAMYLGLLLTELYINSLKYAFENKSDKKISCNLTKENETVSFVYTDNGIGSEKIIYLKLIDKLCRQLKIIYKLETNDGFNFSFQKRF